ncbi:SDR family NAD(P)-dependent oxidoreductase [Paenibacillus eucommiae]|uniref:NAD(P)-dependent dehydrogenase (Short-subunit alcohol dehydrogenase family) n=1 Tax=Paenibacillus eucommiae TaxID=1355755 RepID=A0ABS4IM81_9BACL|nr:SDR family NAD(P)-dependent oxidoreductase [Paenibacillus eucommiae]MBP1988618.1 NAD(P)-dependent dehydrogenase (short-subunit alcohol dehydrogenase family) [Paenibacillus eucommiae]
MEGKIALITGGSLGIGRAIAQRFAWEGAKVAISGRGSAALEEAASFIREQGGEVLILESDVQDQVQVHRMVDDVLHKWGSIDVLVHNAGINNPTPFLDISEAEWDRHININLKGAFLVSQRVCREMVKRKQQGAVILMSSVNGLAAEADLAHYNTSKGGMNLLAMSMALELAPLGIRVNALCPGFIETRLTKPVIDNKQAINDYLKSIPMGRVGQPEEIADAAVFLASEQSRYITGHCLVVDGGQIIKLS